MAHKARVLTLEKIPGRIEDLEGELLGEQTDILRQWAEEDAARGKNV